MSRLRLALVLHSPSGGGAQRRSLDLAAALARLGHRVSLVMAEGDGELAAMIDPAVERVVLPLPWRPGRRRLACALMVPALARWLARARPDVLMAAANHVHLTAIAAHALAGRPCRLVLRASNHLLGGGRGRPFEDWLKRRSLRLYARADAVVAVSRTIAGQLPPGLPVAVLPNPVVDATFAARMAAPSPHPWLGGPVPVILGCGRLERQKDFATLVRAAARLKARLIILGEGSQRASLRDLADELEVALALPGFVADPLPWMARAQAFALSSAWEGLPGALIEAMACGIPCVATPWGGEVLDGLGPLVPVGDDCELARALARVMVAAPPAEALRRRAAQFSVEAGARAYESLFTALSPTPPGTAAGRPATRQPWPPSPRPPGPAGGAG